MNVRFVGDKPQTEESRIRVLDPIFAAGLLDAPSIEHGVTALQEVWLKDDTEAAEQFACVMGIERRENETAVISILRHYRPDLFMESAQ